MNRHPSRDGAARRTARFIPLLLLACLPAVPAMAQAVTPHNVAPVSREEYEELKKNLDTMRAEIAELRRQQAVTTTQAADSQEIAKLQKQISDLRKETATQQTQRDEELDEVNRIIKDVKDRTAQLSAGTTKILITGDAEVGFSAVKNAPSTFEAGVAPRFLWELDKRILFDAAFDIGVSGTGDTNFDMTIGNVSYLVNDYIVIGAGLFVVPFGQYHPHYDPPWINPLPDDPLVFSDGGLAPSSALGAFISGAVPIYSTKINYAFYGSNGPSLETSDPSTAGSLNFDNYTDLNNNKAFGGRIGFLPIPELEFGYSIQCGQASPEGFQNVNTLLNAVDVSYRKQIPLLLGTVQARAEWVWSDVGQATYDVNNPDGTTTTLAPFNNDRNGGYFLVSYRPTLSSYKVLRNIETIFRYDRMDAPQSAPGGQQEQRYTVGVDYWFDPRVVLKAAYECDEIAHASGNNAFMVQVGVGF